jgi:hypothetical protein
MTKTRPDDPPINLDAETARMRAVQKDILELSATGIHGDRLIRAAASQAELMATHVPDRLLHCLSRYGVWAAYLADELEAGKLTREDATKLLRTFAKIQEGAFASFLEEPADFPEIVVNPSEQEMDLLFAEEIVAD